MDTSRKMKFRVRLTVDEQFGDDGPVAGDEGLAFYYIFDEGETWHFVWFDRFGRDSYYVVREDMIEEV